MRCHPGGNCVEVPLKCGDQLPQGGDQTQCDEYRREANPTVPVHLVLLGWFRGKKSAGDASFADEVVSFDLLGSIARLQQLLERILVRGEEQLILGTSSGLL
jgi:hypothetical protein